MILFPFIDKERGGSCLLNLVSHDPFGLICSAYDHNAVLPCMQHVCPSSTTLSVMERVTREIRKQVEPID